jgi:hypothetical protein
MQSSVQDKSAHDQSTENEITFSQTNAMNDSISSSVLMDH